MSGHFGILESFHVSNGYGALITSMEFILTEQWSVFGVHGADLLLACGFTAI